MLRATAPLALCLALGLAGCVPPPTSAQKLAESAYDLNTAARFGRMDLAMEQVKDTSREEFTRQHALWGRAVRIVDYEFGGVSVRQDGDAEVIVTLNWQRPDDTNLRTTEILQRWTNKRGTWWMIREEERGGDPGLFGTLPAIPTPTDAAPAASGDGDAAPAAPAAPAVPAAAQQARSRYQTRTIYEQ
jgi:hypothetical protein